MPEVIKPTPGTGYEGAWRLWRCWECGKWARDPPQLAAEYQCEACWLAGK